MGVVSRNWAGRHNAIELYSIPGVLGSPLILILVVLYPLLLLHYGGGLGAAGFKQGPQFAGVFVFFCCLMV